MPRLASKNEFRRVRARLLASHGRDFEKAAFPLLRLLFPSLVPTPTLGSFDCAGVDFVAWGDDDRLDTVVQCKGFKVHEAELGKSQVQQCAKSILDFSKSGQRASRFILAHNRTGKSDEFRAAVQAELVSLEAAGVVERAELLSCEDLMTAVAEELRSRLLANMKDSTSPAPASNATQNLNAVPLRAYDMIVDRHRLKGTRNEQYRIADPASEIVSASGEMRDLVVLLGEAGFGKTTAVMRAGLSTNQRVFMVRAAGLTDNPVNKNTLFEQFRFVDDLLCQVPDDDLLVLRPLAQAAIESLFSTPHLPCILIIDGLDESITLTRRGGLQWLFNCLNDFEIPVVLVARTEFWLSRATDFATSFGRIAAVKGSPQRDVTVHVVELLSWRSEQILALTERFTNVVDDAACRDRVEAFATLVRDDRYAQVYGDIPTRPLFLRMILETIARIGIHRMNRVDLLEEWAREKITRDYIEPLRAGGSGRMSIHPGGEPVDITISLAFQAMMRAAALMTQSRDGQLELRNSCRVRQVLDAEPLLSSVQDPLGLVLNSLLIPTEHTNAEMVRFGHQLYQEFFLARFIADHEDEFAGLTLPREVDVWLGAVLQHRQRHPT